MMRKGRLLRWGIGFAFIVQTEDHSQILQAEVVGLHYFDDFRQLYQQLPLEKCGYRQEELSQAKPEDMELYYSKDRQAKYGVVGIELKLL